MPNDISKIDSAQSIPSPEQSADTTHHAQSAGKTENSCRNLNNKSVSLTDMAEHLQSLEQKLSSTQSDIDQAHVDRIREAISSGEFRIDPEKVANKLLDLESDF